MANILITSEGEFLKIVFADSSANKSTRIRKNCIAEIEVLPAGGVYITKNYTSLQQGYKLSFDDNGGGDQVDAIGGVAPTSEEDLADKILALSNS